MLRQEGRTLTGTAEAAMRDHPNLMVYEMSHPTAEPQAIAAAFERSSVGVVITTAEGLLLAANPVACRLIGDGKAVDEVLLQAVRNAALAGSDALGGPLRRGVGAWEFQLHRIRYATPAGRIFDVVEIVDVTAFRRREQRLLDRLKRDSLTGLASRDAFFEAASRLIEERRRVARPLAVAMIDLDDFKLINDRAGHAVGDQVLAGVAECCRLGLREGDVIGRLGGDEIAILLPGALLADAALVAERIRAALRHAAATDALAGQAVTLSIGLALRRPGEASIEPALERADRALYAAKAAGGDRMASSAD
jgi:diguanylate cyclase (GGDEF)-like protein